MVVLTRNSSGSSERRAERLTQLDNRRSKDLGKCKIQTPEHYIKKCEVVLHKIDDSVLRQHGITVSQSNKRLCRSNCKACPQIISSSSFYSTVTGRSYSLINHSGEDINCKSQNFIYLITCESCFCQYVGETKFKRLIERKSCVRSLKLP